MQLPVNSSGKMANSAHNVSSAYEGFFGRPENEFLYYDDWGEVPIEEFLKELDAYMHYYTEEREKESLGWLSPFQYRKSLGIAA